MELLEYSYFWKHEFLIEIALNNRNVGAIACQGGIYYLANFLFIETLFPVK